MIASLACGAAGGSDAPGGGVSPFGSAPGAAGSAPSTASASGGPSAAPANPTGMNPSSPNSTETAQNPNTPLTGSGAGGSNGNGSGNTGTAGSASTGAAGGGSMPAANGGASAGSAGSAGTSGQGSDPGTTTLPTPPGNAFFFDDFEAGAPGTAPAAWKTWIDYILTAANTPTSAEFALLDDSDKHSGKQSVHFHVTSGTQPAMLTMALPPNTNRLFMRVFVKSSVPLGGRPADSVSNHETLLGLRATPNDGNFEIRFGEVKGALGYNMVGTDRSDAVSPPMSQ
ncbi:MAG TPA: hypothetical protein VG963_23950, partial [Polyangiaceae bacterium]|nr:hypothetical protein [Polyangiaceae bacterium]